MTSRQEVSPWFVGALIAFGVSVVGVFGWLTIRDAMKPRQPGALELIAKGAMETRRQKSELRRAATDALRSATRIMDRLGPDASPAKGR